MMSLIILFVILQPSSRLLTLNTPFFMKKILLSLAMLLTGAAGMNAFAATKMSLAETAVLSADDAVTSSVFIEPFQINPGEEKEILVNLNNPDLEVISFQFDLQLPEGIEVVYDEDEEYYLVDAGSRLKRSYVVDSNKFDNGIFRVLAYSQKNEPVKGTSGDIVKITLKAADTLADGIYTLNFMETTLTKDVEGNSVSVYPENTSCAVSVGNATGIEAVDAAGKRQVIYDLMGRPTNAKQRGVYIINNQKVVK